MQNKLNELVDREDLDEDGLPKIDQMNIEEYIIYYEKLISRKVYSNISKVRDKARKNIQKKYNSLSNKVRSLKLSDRMAQVKAFYEGDIIKMDRTQQNFVDANPNIKWYNWDMVMVIPNPDYKTEKQ
jgi:hypothetical protein